QQSQHWPAGISQGQAELLALKNVVATLSDSVNVGLMLFTSSAGASADYIAYATRPMSATNRASLQALLQNLYTNFSASGTATAANYSAALFDTWKYYGGYTSPEHARDDVAGTPIGTSAFGAQVFAPPPSGYANADIGAYTDMSFTT